MAGSKMHYARLLQRKMEPLYRSDEARAIWLPSLCDMVRAKWASEPDNERLVELSMMDDDQLVRYLRRVCRLADDQPLWPKHFAPIRPQGRQKWYYDFVCHGGCHALATLHLYVAQRVYPNKAWRIVSGEDHTTVWDAERTVFDLQWQAFNTCDANDTLRIAQGY